MSASSREEERYRAHRFLEEQDVSAIVARIFRDTWENEDGRIVWDAEQIVEDVVARLWDAANVLLPYTEEEQDRLTSAQWDAIYWKVEVSLYEEQCKAAEDRGDPWMLKLVHIHKPKGYA